MSANVWFEEVNVGLIKEIQSNVKYKNENGVLVPLSSKAITIRKPEEEFRSEVYPCVSIYNRDTAQDIIRTNTEPIVLEKDYENNQIILGDPAIPFFLETQIDFWSKYQTDMDTMTRTWLFKHYRQFNLSVIDDGGTERSCNCLQKSRMITSDLVSGGERLFHKIIIYQIWVEIDEETRYNVPMVVDRDIKTNQVGD